MVYKLTKDNVSVIRVDHAGVTEAEDEGFVLQGGVDADDPEYQVIAPGARPEKPKKASQPKDPKDPPTGGAEGAPQGGAGAAPGNPGSEGNP